MPGNPKLGGLESILAMLTIDTPDGANVGGDEAGDTELSLSGDLEEIPEGDDNLN